jgi:hypothetical protein
MTTHSKVWPVVTAAVFGMGVVLSPVYSVNMKQPVKKYAPKPVVQTARQIVHWFDYGPLDESSRIRMLEGIYFKIGDDGLLNAKFAPDKKLWDLRANYGYSRPDSIDQMIREFVRLNKEKHPYLTVDNRLVCGGQTVKGADGVPGDLIKPNIWYRIPYRAELDRK